MKDQTTDATTKTIQTGYKEKDKTTTNKWSKRKPNHHKPTIEDNPKKKGKKNNKPKNKHERRPKNQYTTK